MDVSRETQRLIRRLERQVSDLRALVDTLQAALRRADTALEDTDEYEYVFAQSAKWAMNEKI